MHAELPDVVCPWIANFVATQFEQAAQAAAITVSSVKQIQTNTTFDQSRVTWDVVGPSNIGEEAGCDFLKISTL